MRDFVKDKDSISEAIKQYEKFLKETGGCGAMSTHSESGTCVIIFRGTQEMLEEAHAAVQPPQIRRFKSLEERKRIAAEEAEELSRDPGQLEALRDWEGSMADGSGDR